VHVTHKLLLTACTVTGCKMTDKDGYIGDADFYNVLEK